MPILVTRASAQWLPGGHPEMMGMGLHHMHGLAKALFGLDAVAAKLKYLEGRQRRTGSQQKDGASQRVVNNAKAHDVSDWLA